MNENPDAGTSFTVIAMALLIGSISSPAAARQSQRQSTKSSSAATQLLSRGLFYYNNNDDNAARQFQQVIKQYPSSQEGEDAQYYLGSYYQRKYFVKRKSKSPDPRELRDILINAEAAFQKYISRFTNNGSRKWLSDAEFNLSLVYLLEGDQKRALLQLDDMLDKSSRDQSVYIYQVDWPLSRKDVIDSNFDAKQLAQFTRSLPSVNALSQSGVDQIIADIKKWCQSQKGLKLK